MIEVFCADVSPAVPKPSNVLLNRKPGVQKPNPSFSEYTEEYAAGVRGIMI